LKRLLQETNKRFEEEVAQLKQRIHPGIPRFFFFSCMTHSLFQTLYFMSSGDALQDLLHCSCAVVVFSPVQHTRDRQIRVSLPSRP
jgi:hypothetical protein